MSRRSERVSDLIRQEIGDILLREVSDPRLKGLVSITQVETAPDLKHARVFVSVLGSEAEKQEALKGLEAATGFVRHELGARLSLRYVPQISFRLDDSIERGARLLELIREVTPEESRAAAEEEEEKDKP